MNLLFESLGNITRSRSGKGKRGGRHHWCPTFVKVRYSKWLILSDSSSTRTVHDLNEKPGLAGLRPILSQ